MSLPPPALLSVNHTGLAPLPLAAKAKTPSAFEKLFGSKKTAPPPLPASMVSRLPSFLLHFTLSSPTYN
jgi:hypothetical protein